MKTTKSIILLAALAAMLTACGQALNKDAPNSVSLERDYQEVVHYDCNNNVVHDGIETVSSPTQWVSIYPNNPGLVATSTFHDEQTGSNAGLIVNNSSFQVDYSYGAVNMHVAAGQNLIDYKFYNSANQVIEQGTTVVSVNYTEKTIPGKLNVSDCQPTPTPTPVPH